MKLISEASSAADTGCSGSEALVVGGDKLGSKLKALCSVTFGNDSGASSAVEASSVGEAGGADGPVGDCALPFICRLAVGTLGRAEVGGAGRKGDRGGDRGALGGDVGEWKTGLVGGDVARLNGEGGALEKGDTRGELRGEEAALSSALEKMKAVSVRLRW